MNDTILLKMPDLDFGELVRRAFEAHRAGYIQELIISPLAQSSLVEACFLSGESVTPNVRGWAVQAVLRWAVGRLRPEGEHDWTAYNWRLYNTLDGFYIQGMRVLDLATEMSLSEQTIYDLRPLAFEAITQVLRDELAAPLDVQGRKQVYIAGRCAGLAHSEQLTLRVAAVFRHPVPLAVLELLLAEAADQPPATLNVAGLVNAHLLVSDDEHTAALVHPEVRSYVLGALSPTERRRWHRAAGVYYRQQCDYLEAAMHFCQAGICELAADILIAHHRDIENNLQMEDLRDVLARFRPVDVSEAVWAHLKIIAGGVAEAMQDANTAIAEYAQALGAPDLDTKAQAYYRRAKVLEQNNLDEAIAHYKYCIHLLESNRPGHPLLAKAYIDAAWVFIQDRPDLVKAEIDLARARPLIGELDRETWSQWYSACGELAYRQGHLESAAEYHLQGWLAAVEVQNIALMLNSSHNLGTLYAEMGQHQQGLEYLQKCLALAVQAGNRRMEGACNKGIGECYFWLKNYPEAIRYYLVARDIFVKMGNRSWQARVYYNLAEAYAELGEMAQAKDCFNDGLMIARQLDMEWFIGEFDALALRYAGLIPLEAGLSDRQVSILEFVRTHGAITSEQAAEVIARSKETAVRDLKEMVHRHILMQKGGGRGTHYVLNF